MQASYRRLVRSLRGDRCLPLGARDIRFFDVAERLTGRAGFGILWHGPLALRWAISLLGLGRAVIALRCLSDVLLLANRDVLERMRGSDALCSPSSGSGPPLGALEFDEQMVVFEQLAVERHLRARLVEARDRRGVERLFRACSRPWLSRVLGLDPALARAIGSQCEAGGSFFSLATRIAVGQCLVRAMHGDEPPRDRSTSASPASPAWRRPRRHAWPHA